MTEAHLKDEILIFCVNLKKGTITTDTIEKGIPEELSRVKINSLLRGINEHLGEHIFELRFNKTTSTLFVTINELVNDFLNEGGFTKLEEDKKKRIKSEKPKWYNESWIGYLIAFITLIFSFYQGYQNNNLGKDISSLDKSVDSLNLVILSQTKNYDSLNIQFRSFEKKLSDLKKNNNKKNN